MMFLAAIKKRFEGRAALKKAQENPLFIDPIAAIFFALQIDDHYEVRDFLTGWVEGAIEEWPEFDGSRDCQPKVDQ